MIEVRRLKYRSKMIVRWNQMGDSSLGIGIIPSLRIESRKLIVQIRHQSIC
jgi:hypothetical protein